MKSQHKDILQRFQAPADWMAIETIDMHTGGEPLRVFVSGLPKIEGNTILEKRRFFKEHYDFIRTGMMFEPRGHADMYGAILTEPLTPDGDFGVFFLHNEGYSTMCGHAIIALTKLALETGMIETTNNNPVLQIDAPPGRIVASATLVENKVQHISFLNVPSFVLFENEIVEVPTMGPVHFDVAFGGAFYAIVDANPLGLNLDASNYNALIDAGKKIKKTVIQQFAIQHPYEEELGFLYGTIFTGAPEKESHHSRNVCIFAEGEVDRSPTGSGVSARAALHHLRGEMSTGQTYTIESILGTTMDVRVVKTTQFGQYDAVIPEVAGDAYITGKHTFYFDPSDPLQKGFIFR